MNEVRLIDANALKEAINNNDYACACNNFFGGLLFKIIDNAPTVEPEVYMTAKDYNLYLEGYKQGRKDFGRPQGEWTNKHFEHADCSLCGRTNDYHGDFCKYCGADMRGSKNESNN